MKILKKCLTCGAEFIASKMSNKYCCRECERDASRKREAKRKKSVRESEKEAALDKERDAVASRPFLTPSDVALLLDMSVSTVYRCFYSGIIKAVRIRRKTLVRREDLDKYFEDAGPYRKRSYKRKQEQEYYTLQEIMDKYKIGRKAVWGRCDSIIRKSKFPQNPKRSVRFSGKRTKRSVQKRKARNTQKAETKVL